MNIPDPIVVVRKDKQPFKICNFAEWLSLRLQIVKGEITEDLYVLNKYGGINKINKYGVVNPQPELEKFVNETIQQIVDINMQKMAHTDNTHAKSANC